VLVDFLKVFTKHKAITKDLHVYLIETSGFLRRIQFEKLCGEKTDPSLLTPYKHKTSTNINITWLDDISQLPGREAVHYYLANEFFDALPIHKFKVSIFNFNKL
jgi:SAM-dependent MidA family methyltransferase